MRLRGPLSKAGKVVGFTMLVLLSGGVFSSLALAESPARTAGKSWSAFGLPLSELRIIPAASGLVIGAEAGTMTYDPKNTVLSFQRSRPDLSDARRVGSYPTGPQEPPSDLAGCRLSFENDQGPGIPDNCYLVGVRFSFKRFEIQSFKRSVSAFVNNFQNNSSPEKPSAVSFYFDLPE